MFLFRPVLALLVLLAGLSTAQALSYRVEPLKDGRCGAKRPCPVAFVATGEIERDELLNFRRFIRGLNQRALLPSAFVIQSKGGNLAGAFGLGLVLRELGIPVIAGAVDRGTVDRGFCGSACVFVLMGGKSRQVPPGSVIAVHSPRRVPEKGVQGGEELSASDPDNRRQITRILSDYTRLMGVDPALVALTMSVPPDSGRVLTPAEIRRFRLSTTGRKR